MQKAQRTGPYQVGGFQFWVQNCTIWYDSDGNGSVDRNETWAEFKANPAFNQATKNGVEAQLDALGCPTP